MTPTSLRWLPGALAMVLAWGAPSTAQAGRLVVRLQTQGADVSAPVTVKLTSETGASAESTLLDDGATPDVTADDGMWSSAVQVDGDTLSIEVMVGSKTYDAGSVTWTNTDAPRDLDLTISGGKVTANAANAENALPPPAGATGAVAPDGVTPDGEAPVSLVENGAEPGLPPASADGPPASGGGPGGPGAPGAPSATGPATAATGGAGGNAQLFIGLGVGVLALVLIGWLWFSNHRRADDDLPSPEPEPGLLGPNTPSLSGGPSIWRTQPDAVNQLAWSLVARIARHRRVVLATEDGISIGAVYGGPVYLASAMDVEEIADIADALEEQGGSQVAVVLVGAAAAAAILPGLRAELSETTGLAIIGALGETVEPKAMRCTPSEGAWTIQGPDGTTRVRVGAFGLQPPGPARS